ncbi:MAG: polysaccharide export protein [Lacunisphaera sp.]|nr:polysaccharide export protein [Lacunisphaera sp.]
MKPSRLLLALLAALLAGGPTSLRAQSDSMKAEKKNYVHTLALADKLRISVYQEDDLSTQARIDARGRVNLPLLGEITIGGMTVTEAQAAVENAYKEGRYLRNPQVTINVEEYATREVSIQGQIRSPGRFSLPPESTYTVVELVSKAGGITDIGKGTAVVITRILADGTKKVFTVDVDSIIKGKKDNKSEDFLLQTGDNVYVPERLI